MKKNFKFPVLYCLCGIVALGIIALLIMWGTGRSKQENHATLPPALETDPDVTVVYRDVDRLVQVEKEITATVIQDGLNDMGVLITQEYFFTEVVSFSSMKQLFGLNLGFTETSFIGTYDGTVTAGIDFQDIRIEKDDQLMKIKVYLPGSSVQYIDIDPNSFVLYDETSGIGNPISVTDFNRSLIELENNAQNKAIEKGLLGKADENARLMIRNFISGMVGLDDYTIEFVTE